MDKRTVLIANIARYGISFVVGCLIALAVAMYCDKNYYLFSTTDTVKLYALLSDVFLFPGIILMSFGLLIAISNEGFFDMLGYALSGFTYLFSRHRTEKAKETFYDYHLRKKLARDGRAKWYLVFVGLIFMIPCVIFALLYLKYK